MNLNYWPYDEVTVSKGQSFNEYTFETPWLSISSKIKESDVVKADLIINKIKNNSLNTNDLKDVSWLFAALAEFPLAYILPRHIIEGKDEHNLTDNILINKDPIEVLSKTSFMIDDSYITKHVGSQKGFPKQWLWDLNASLEFSQCSPGKYDPLSLLSLSRRFHLLDTIEKNKTPELYEKVTALKDDQKLFKHYCAVIVRQNHYVTQRCDGALKPALEIAQSAVDKVQEFRQAEKGHDKLIHRALMTFCEDSDAIPVMPSTTTLMNLLEFCAQRNFLAFALVVDMFERSPYSKDDPLATLLKAGGLDDAAYQINVHKQINDSGEHENVSLGLLSEMAPVSAEYAEEALRLAEITSSVMYLVFQDIIDS